MKFVRGLTSAVLTLTASVGRNMTAKAPADQAVKDNRWAMLD
jgi:hypothetical protein